MKKSLLLAAMFLFSAVQAETYVCTSKKRSTTMRPVSGISTNYSVTSSNEASGYIVDTRRGMRSFNGRGGSMPDFVGSCDDGKGILYCSGDWNGSDFMSVQIDLNRLWFTSSVTQGRFQMVVASVGNCIKL